MVLELTTPHHRRVGRTLTVLSLTTLTLAGAAVAGPSAPAADLPRGHDVSSHQKNVDWPRIADKGASFVYVKATESHTYRNPYFDRQYDGARSADLVRGAYHFALPDKSSGKKQAGFFARNGGDGGPDGWTLPPALDLENNPYNAKKRCYGMGADSMRRWITSFSDETLRLTGRRPVIYTTAKWWNDCTNHSKAFARDHALWLANWSRSPGKLPAGWTYWTFWQHAESGKLPGDQNVFNGSTDQLHRFAGG
ncbi:lysozyme [Streptomyces tsukubensis]|uniref:lysozyme n=1 Tax=Streptomyces tsukubensis TaxID=83656 RepID=A0A1V4A3I0_9ACTN|nr:lysozyme [Streptomyces tsukubensis]OON74004.1 hypothetical protein B1H18_26180 [Streptomyces tsukubensis]QFR92950.1 hydrolase [Streptomyces tsukubensis]